MYEIERKFLIQRLPEIVKQCEKDIVEQGYLSITPEVRVRTRYRDPSNPRYYKLSIKSDGGLKRKEIEIDLTKEQYEGINSCLHAPMIIKQYYIIKLDDGHKLEIFVVDPGMKTSFIYTEIEFSTEDEAKLYKLPEWFVEECEPIEVTGRAVYYMKNYWQLSRIIEKSSLEKVDGNNQ